MIAKRHAPTVLSVGPMDHHQAELTCIVEETHWPEVSSTRGKVEHCSGLETALEALESNRFPVVLCDGDGEWRAMLEYFRDLPDPPFLIVTSRIADERLWCEALNLGAYDVLAKPFDATEVGRVLSMACLRWKEQSAPPKRVLRAC